ncbi:MAG: hypothetical protein SF028_07795 [Candidatus Sumerlaeia bacterium]|nr:hypothetical protein [Candidatus Sumerlaeia bacterium]
MSATLAPEIEARLKDLEQEYEARRQQILQASIAPLREQLKHIEHQIAELTNKRNEIQGTIDRMTGNKTAAAKTAGVKKARRPILRFEQKREKIAQIFREESVSHGFPLKAIAKRMQREANLTPADLSPREINKFLPEGFVVEGSGRQKTIARHT